MVLTITPAAEAGLNWGLGRWEGDTTLLVNWETQHDKRTQDRYDTLLFEERLRLRNTGAFIFDPRLLTLNLSGSFGAPQEMALGHTDTSLRVGNGTLFDYAFEGLVLADTAYPTTLFATRSQTMLTQGFGGRSDLTFQSFGGTFDLHENNFLEARGWRGLTATLDAREESLLENSSYFGSPFKRDETRQIVNAQAHRSGENSDLDLHYELNSVSDPLNPSNVFDSHTFRATHSLDFGPTLNRRLDSGLYSFIRSGASNGSYVSASEALHVDHHRDFSTNYRYDFSQSDSESGTTTTNTANATLLRRFYRNLSTTLGARGSLQNFPNGDKYLYGGEAGADYRRAIPGQGQLFADTHLGYEVDNNNFTSSFVDEPDERQTVPIDVGTGAGFTLTHPFVVIGSIVVVDLGPDGNSRFDTIVNRDYLVVAEGSRTRIVPLPDSPVLRAGDQLSVSYTYTIAPSLEYSTFDTSIRTGLEFPWLSLSYEHMMSDQTRLSGTSAPQFLIDQNADRFQLELRSRWKRLLAQSAVDYEILKSSIVDSNGLRFGQLLVYQINAGLVAELTADENFVDYPKENRSSESYLARASIDWTAFEGLSASPFIDYRSFHDSTVMSDVVVEAGMRLHWTYRSVDIFPTVTWTDYRNRMDGVHAELRITRRFF